MKLSREWYNYEIFPLVVLAGETNTMTLRGLGWHAGIVPGEEYEITISAAEQGDPELYPEWAFVRTVRAAAAPDGSLRFDFAFPSEQEYFLRFTPAGGEGSVCLSVYALNGDMRGLYPFRGDLHVHSRRSDGKECPEVVCANYRIAGYDFMAITDHRRYYPSLEAMRALDGALPGFTVVPGEEVHLPLTDIHIINFGGHYSVNALVDGNANQKERGDDPEARSDNGLCPPVLSLEEYQAQIRRLAEEKRFDAQHADTSFAVCLWAFDRIREAGGLGIFCHPYWRVRYGYQVPEAFVDRMLEEHPFDAFEVLGGELYYEQNGFQAAKYYEMLAGGFRFPIVGSTDSHNSTEYNPKGRLCSTIVFAPENQRDSLIASIKEGRTVAVDTISEEYRLVGSLRLQKYACFLLKYWYPLHDRVCSVDGGFLRRLVTGDADARAGLDAVRDEMRKLMDKAFSV